MSIPKRLEVAARETRLTRFGAGQHTSLISHFDRFPGAQEAQGAMRIHFLSAMPLLGHNDGADQTGGVSCLGLGYLELTELLIRQGAEPEHHGN